jgi:hypothetical protein
MSPQRKEQGTHTPASPTVSAGVWPKSLETIAAQGFGGALKVYTFSYAKCRKANRHKALMVFTDNPLPTPSFLFHW